MFGFNTASVASGLNGIAASIASGTHAINSTIGAVGNVVNSIENLGNVLNGIFTGNYTGGISSNGISAAVATGGSPTEWLNQYISNAYSENGIIRYIYSKLFKDLMPDISGYTLLFMAPPVLSGYLQLGNQNYSINSTSFLTETTKLFPLLATNFTPPTIQLNSGALAGSSGTQHYASELSITDSMSVTYVDTIELDIYTFHSSWMQYIFQVLEGTLEPSSEYLLSRTIDYCASFYFVKFQPNLSTIQYVGKAIGCFPKEQPSQDVLGNRSSNELTSMTFNYTVSDYREATMKEDGHWLFSELQNLIISQYTSATI